MAITYSKLEKLVYNTIRMSDYYSKDIIYNNFPFPDAHQAAALQAVEAAAQAVLDVRKPHQADGASLTDLCDPLKMPAELLAAHQRLDLAVDACYGIKKVFLSEAGRVGWLFGRWQNINSQK